jgi:hypothetical protein
MIPQLSRLSFILTLRLASISAVVIGSSAYANFGEA